MSLNRCFALLIVTLFLVPVASISQETIKKRQLIRIQIDQKENFKLLENLNLDIASARMDKYAEVVATDEEIRQIELRGFKTEIIPVDPPGVNVTGYRSYEEVVALCQYYAATYPGIVVLDTLGYSQVRQLWMPVLKVSDHPQLEEDEPAVLYDGLHHAREPVGMESALYILEHILTNYGVDDQITKWVNEYEIWFIPMVNPEGYQYLYENNLSSPWWRKNLRDNDENGLFNPDQDGVDLNRNYDFNWNTGGANDPGSWTYRGPTAFSESETRAKRDLALQQNFLLSHSYHSYGEVVIYPWNNFDRAPDQDLIAEIAGEVAKRIPSVTGTGTYRSEPSSGSTGFSKTWMYGALGTIEFTVETATVFIPAIGPGMAIARSNLAGGLYLLERMEGPGFTGHIVDATTGQPVSAVVKILGYDTDVVHPRRSDSTYGRFWRLMQPGTYSIRVSQEGYVAQNVHNIEVNDSTWTEVHIMLDPVTSGTDPILAEENGRLDIQLFPNPFTDQTMLNLKLDKETRVKIRILDLHGREVCYLCNETVQPGLLSVTWDGKNGHGEDIPAGIYLASVQTNDNQGVVRILKTK